MEKQAMLFFLAGFILLACPASTRRDTTRSQPVICEELGPGLRELSRGIPSSVDPQCFDNILPSMTLFTETNNQGCKMIGRTNDLDYFNGVSSCSSSIKEVSNFTFLVHGFMPSHAFLVNTSLTNVSENIWIEDWIRMKNKLVLEKDMGVIVVNWRRGADVDLGFLNKASLVDALVDLVNLIPYHQAAVNTRYMGAAIAKVMQKIIVENHKASFHCIGHSLGAHTCGFAGKALKISSTFIMKRISGLDPAKLLFLDSQNIPESARLSKGDAERVDIIHSDSLLFGSFKQIGHFDFYPGEEGKFGFEQPGAGLFGSHSSAIFMYLSSIGSEHCFATKYCSSITNKVEQNCEDIRDGPGMGHPIKPSVLKSGAYAIEIINKSINCASSDGEKFLLPIEEDTSKFKDTLGILAATQVINTIFQKIDEALQENMDSIKNAVYYIRNNVSNLEIEEARLVTSVANEWDSLNNKLHSIQTKLKILAKETIFRSNTLIKWLQKYKSGETKYTKFILRRVANLLERSEKMLDEASEVFKGIQDNYDKIKNNLLQFKKSRVDVLKIEVDNAGTALEYQEKWGRIIYGAKVISCIGAAGASIYIPGTGAPEYIAFKACSSSIKGIFEVEIDIKDLREAIFSMDSKLAKFVNKLDSSIAHVKRKGEILKQEKDIAEEWKHHVKSILVIHHLDGDEKGLDELMIENDLAIIADGCD